MSCQGRHKDFPDTSTTSQATTASAIAPTSAPTKPLTRNPLTKRSLISRITATTTWMSAPSQPPVMVM